MEVLLEEIDVIEVLVEEIDVVEVVLVVVLIEGHFRFEHPISALQHFDKHASFLMYPWFSQSMHFLINSSFFKIHSS